MDQILFSRLRAYVVQTLGPAFQADLSKLAVCVMQFVENKIVTPLEGNEKLSLALSWITQLLSEVGTELAPDLISLLTGFISRICEAAKGELEINQGTTATTPTKAASVTTAALPVPAKRLSLKKKQAATSA